MTASASTKLMEAVMSFRSKIYFIILGIVAQLWFFGDIQANDAQPNHDAAEQEYVTAPEHHARTLVSVEPWVIEGEFMGAVAAYVYNDVTTERPADYWELYDKEGKLLAVSWFDRLGFRKTAVDRGILEETGELDGIFVEVVDGNPI
jgi:hypothetical protein